MLEESLPNEPAAPEAVCNATLTCRLINWLYRISKETGLVNGGLPPNDLLNTYQACLVWYELAMKNTFQEEQGCSFLQYVLQVHSPYLTETSSD